MGLDLLAILAALVVTLTSLVLLTSDDWRLNIIFLSVQYAGLLLLLAPAWPLAMTVSQLVAGWMGGAVLSIAAANAVAAAAASSERARRRRFRTNPFFFLVAALLGGMAFLSQIPQVMGFIPNLSLAQAWGALILVGLGMIRLGFGERPLPITIGLLTILSGFTILITRLNTDPLTAGMLAGISLAISLAGAYLLTAPEMGARP
jgi:hypothetical protein